jgi:hypothetical protein
LIHRPDWTGAMIGDAFADARILRQAIQLQFDTGLLAPKAIATKILDWLEQIHKDGYQDGRS